VLRNPPLFDWLYFGLSQLIGVGGLTIQILKTVLLTGAGIFLYLAVRPVFRHRLALDAAIVSYGTTAFYGWDVFQQFSHTVTLILSMAFTLWALMRVVRHGRPVDYALLGLGLGLGILSKFLFALYFVALLAAALRSPGYRPAILSWRMAMTPVVAIIVVSPLFLSLSIDGLFSTLGGRVVGAGGGPDLGSLGYLVVLTAEFWLPLAAILWACLAGAKRAGAGQAVVDVRTGADDDSFYPLVRDATLIMVLALIVSVLFLGTKIAEGRYLVAFLSLLPLTIFAGLDRREPFPAPAVEGFRRVALVFIVGVAVVRFLIFLFVSPPFCLPRCVVFVDYAPLAAKIGTVEGKQNVILTNHVHIGANLLRLLPNTRVSIASYTGEADLGIAEPSRRNCYLVWFRLYGGADEVTAEAALERALGRRPSAAELAAVAPSEDVTLGWQTKLPWAWGPKLMWEWGADPTVAVARIDSAAPICEGGRNPG
jgi:4-amino-4-deoxy-L-arabinose transferase-like glycosyltransferase